jgi:hypothetical protein
MERDRDKGGCPHPFTTATFYVTTGTGVVAVTLVCTLGPLPVQIGLLGLLLSLLLGLLMERATCERDLEVHRVNLLESFRIPLTLAPEHEFFDQYCSFAHGLEELTKQTDPVLREFVLLKLASISGEINALSRGKVTFHSTETWRTVYRKLLEGLEVKAYYSVAWLKSSDYWQDPPGRQSMNLNYELVERGFRLERILILPDLLWPFEKEMPYPEIRPWIEEQHNRGIWISLVREHHLLSEPDLLCDFGVYGDRATGEQELDDQSRTLRFILCFDRHSLKMAHDRWERLSLYATPCCHLLDRN